MDQALDQSEARRGEDQLTLKIARGLREELGPRGFEVHYDHGRKDKEGTGHIFSWFGGPKPTESTRLSMLDAMVVDPASGNALALIEINETSGAPKMLLADVLGILMGQHLGLEGQEYRLGPWTTLIVMGRSDSGQEGRLRYVAGVLESIKTEMGTPNSSIGKIVLNSFKDEPGLRAQLGESLESALTVGTIWERFGGMARRVEIPLQKGKSFHARLMEGGIEVDCLPGQPLLQWHAFARAMILLRKQGGAAERGDAPANCKLGDPGLTVETVEGYIAQKVYRRKAGEPVYRRVAPVAAILVWAGLCEQEAGKLVVKKKPVSSIQYSVGSKYRSYRG